MHCVVAVISGSLTFVRIFLKPFRFNRVGDAQVHQCANILVRDLPRSKSGQFLHEWKTEQQYRNH